MDGNNGLELECQRVTIVSALQGTRTSSKLFRVEHRVPPRVRKSRNKATCQSKNRTLFGGGWDLQILNIPQQASFPKSCWGQQECGLSWASWPILQKEDTVYHAWRGSAASSCLGPRRRFIMLLGRTVEIQMFYSDNDKRARRQSIALDKSRREAIFLVDTHPFIWPATILEC